MILGLGVVVAAAATPALLSGREPAAAVEAPRLRAADVVFSGLIGSKIPARELVLRNVGAAAQTVTSIDLTGAIAAFRVASTLPATIAPGGSLRVPVVFDPPATNVGSVDATALVSVAGSATPSTVVELRGLATRSEFDEGEPALATIVATLGYRTDIGGRALALGTVSTPIGEEVRAQRFVRAGPGPVRLQALARYSPQGLLELGYRTADGELTAVETLRAEASQTLFPPAVGGAVPTFDPGAAPFSLEAERLGGTRVSTVDDVNPPALAHRMRAYPARSDATGLVLAHTWIVAIEESANGDYQDCVLLLSGADPAPPLAG